MKNYRNQSNYQTWIKLQRKIKLVNARLDELQNISKDAIYCVSTTEICRLLRKLKLLIKKLFNLNRKWRLGIATATLFLWLGNNNINAQNIFDHTNLNGTNGFKIVNTNRNGDLGWDMSDIGDFNGDGIQDMIISSTDLFNTLDDYTGELYVIFGTANPFPSTFDLADLDGTNGFSISDTVVENGTGISVSSAGDFNGDGYDDLLIGEVGSPGGATELGKLYVIFGNNAENSKIGLNNLNGTNGTKFKAHTDLSRFGVAVSGIGDIDNDGFDDITTIFRDANDDVTRVYIIYGTDTTLNAINEVNPLNETSGTVLTASEEWGEMFYLGGSHGNNAISYGDINGDGFPDLVIGNASAKENAEIDAGAVYVVFGSDQRLPLNVDLLALDGQIGFKLAGYEYGAVMGYTIAIGDINGDGFDDIIAGNYTGYYAYDGEVTVLFGKSTGFTSVIEASALDGTDGFEISGFNMNLSTYGYVALDFIEDVNGDGFEDMLIGIDLKTVNAVTNAGQVYVILGTADAVWPAKFDIADLNADMGFVMNGIGTDEKIGKSVAGIGDLNNDGFGDFAFAGVEGLEAYVVFGANDMFPVEQIGFENLPASKVFTAHYETPFREDNLAIGDFNGDGKDEIIVDNWGDEKVLFGTNTPSSKTIDLANLDGTDGFTFIADHMTYGIDLLDINGDGFDDLALGNPYTYWDGGPVGGQIYILFGNNNAQNDTLLANEVTTNERLIIHSEKDFYFGGYNVFNGGDINGDGIEDLFTTSDYGGVVGSMIFGDNTPADSISIDNLTPDLGFTVPMAGIQFNSGDFNNDNKDDFILKHSDLSPVILGKDAGIIDTLDTDTDFDGSNGFNIKTWNSDEWTENVDGIIDFNSDGIDDILFHNANNDTLALVFGHATPFPAELDIINNPGDLNGINGVYISGIPNGQTISSVTTLDFNNDAKDDVIFSLSPSNEVYVIYGNNTGDLSIDISNLVASRGFKVQGFGTDALTVEKGGDLNADGISDLIILEQTIDMTTSTWVAHVIYGHSANNALYNLESLQSGKGYDLVLINEFGNVSRFSLLDYNGDSYNDVVFITDETGWSDYKFILSDLCSDPINTEENVSICSGDNYTYPDGILETNILANTSHESILTSINGCDSTVTTSISVIEPIVTLSEVEVCSGGDFTYPDGATETNITVNTSHISNLISLETGCDSIITTNITVRDILTYTEEVSICSGENYTYPDGITENNITANTSHESLVPVANGCDSLITTNISVIEPVVTVSEVEVCSGGDYTYPDGIVETNITFNTSHISNLFSQVTGCDSTITTNITVNEPIVTLSEVEMCSGNDYTYPDGTTDINITANTSHISNLVSQVTGCDSTITTNITVNEVYAIIEDESVCSGDDYTYPDGTTENNITANTSHISNLVSQVTGCDSTITTNISVNTVNTNVTVNGNILTADNNTADVYQWIDCDLSLPINEETTYTFIATETGNYSVAIEDNNCVDTSSCNSIIISGIEDAESLVQAIWPNPTSGRINIRLTEDSKTTVISIFDVTGKLILQKELVSKETEFTVKMPDGSGVYFVQIKSDTKVSTFKIIKK